MLKPELTSESALSELGEETQVLYEEELDFQHPLMRYMLMDESVDPNSARIYYFLRRIFGKQGFTFSDNFLLALEDTFEEILDNAVFHGPSPEQGHTITVKIAASKQGVFISVGDQGQGVDFTPQPHTEESQRVLPESGTIAELAGQGGRRLARKDVAVNFLKEGGRFQVLLLMRGEGKGTETAS